MNRSAPLARAPRQRSRAALRRRTKVKNANRKRRRAEFARCYGSAARVAFVKSLDCIARQWDCDGEIHNHHTATDGIGRKADASTIVPLCARHRDVLHWVGTATFERMHRIDLSAEAARTERRWQASQGREAS